MRLIINPQRGIAVFLILLLYAVLVFPQAFNPAIGDFESYRSTFEQISRKSLSDFGVLQIISDDLLFYFSISNLIRSSDYTVILSFIIVVNSILYFNLLRLGALKIRQPSIALFVALVISLNPKIFEMLFFNVRQGLGFLLVVHGLYLFKGDTFKVATMALSVLSHLSNLLFILTFLGIKFTSRIRESRGFLVLKCLIACVALVAVGQIVERFNYSWSHASAYTLVVFGYIAATLVSTIIQKVGVNFQSEVLIFGSLVFFGILLDLPTERLVGPVLLFYSLYLGEKKRTDHFDISVLVLLLGYTTTALWFWLS